MSRIGKAPITVPSGVDVTIDGGTVTVKGPKGQLSRPVPGAIIVRQDGDTLLVERPDDERENRSLHGLTRIARQQHGGGRHRRVPEGARDRGRRLPRRGPGPGRRCASPSASATRSWSAPPTASPSRCPAPTRVLVKGIDKEAVGQVAANIRAIRKPEPYKGKGVRYAGERVLRKAGKAGKK